MRRGIMKTFLKVRVRACHRLPTQGCKLSHRKGRIGHTNGNLSKFQIEIGHRVTGLHIVYISRRTRLLVKSGWQRLLPLLLQAEQNFALNSTSYDAL